MSQTSDIHIYNGWNFVSFNIIQDSGDSINTYLNSSIWQNGDIIKSQSSTSTFNNGLWSTNTGLTSITPDKMYKIFTTSEGGSLSFTGRLPYREETKQSLLGNKSWNWISYPLLQDNDINHIFKSYTNMDYLKNQTGFSSYYNGLWRPYGSLNTLESGDGYMLYINDQSRDLEFLDLDPAPNLNSLFTIVNFDSDAGTFDLVMNIGAINQSSNNTNGFIKACECVLNNVNITNISPTTFTSKRNNAFYDVLQRTGDPTNASMDPTYLFWNVLVNNTFASSNTIYFIDTENDGFVIDPTDTFTFKISFTSQVSDPTVSVGNSIVLDSSVDNDGSGFVYNTTNVLSESVFRIQVDLSGSYSQDDAQLVESAKNVWQNIITERSQPSLDTDLHIALSFETMASNVLGYAYPTHYITNSTNHHIPIKGNMAFNTVNWESQKNTMKTNGQNVAFYTILHEIGHILGIGTMWSLNNLLENDQLKYSGTNALREYKICKNDLSLTHIPLEDDGGSGTAYGHPEEGDENHNSRYHDGKLHPGLDAELMTGYSEGSDVPEPLSRITIGFLEDIGFKVDYSKADPYT